MRGAVLYGPNDVRFEERDAPTIVAPTDIELIEKRTIDPGKVFDLTLPLENVAEGYRADG